MSNFTDYYNNFSEGIENILLYHPYIFPSFVLSYILSVSWIGPRLMENRKPFKLQKILIYYNIIEVFMNAYICYGTVSVVIDYKYLRCLPRGHHSIRAAAEKTMLVWKLLVSNKVLELLDTVFFVLRKKKEQLTFLHVSHHSIMCFYTWWVVRNVYQSGGYYLAFPASINTALHCVMYSYYGLSALGPAMAKYLWWKRYLTLAQILQFVLILSYMFVEFLNGCLEVKNVDVALAAHVSLMLYLFVKFYKKNISKKLNVGSHSLNKMD